VGVAMGSILASQSVDFAGSSGGFLSATAIGIGAGIGLGRIAARAAPTPGAPDEVSRELIVTTTRRIVDAVLGDDLYGSLDARPDGNDTSEKNTDPPVPGHRNRPENAAVPSLDSEAVDAVRAGQRFPTPWTETSSSHERKDSPWSGRPV
jgi:hypothetical protein